MSDILNELAGMFPQDRVLIAEEMDSFDDIRRYATDKTMLGPTLPGLIVFPRTTDEVRRIMVWCAENRYPVVPSGGRTGYAGGALAAHREVVVSLEKMNQLIDFDPYGGLITVQAGMITAEVNAIASEEGLFFPIQFAATGSSEIGGNIATNAGGIHVVRYGMTRNWVLSLCVVDGLGRIHRFGNPIIKDNTGYDLKQLFIGSEGTLGIITEATLRLTNQGGNSQTILLAIESLESVLEIFRMARCLPIPLRSYEFFTDYCLEKVILYMDDLRHPFPERYRYYVLISYDMTSGNNIYSTDILSDFVSRLLERELIADGYAAHSSVQAQTFWSYREHISEALSLRHSVHKNDISVPIRSIPVFLTETQRFFDTEFPLLELAIFGHIGDCNLHINIVKGENLSEDSFRNMVKASDRMLFELVRKYNGSISAEHGIGVLKKDFLGYSRSADEVAIMRQLKKIFDPYSILNPGKLFD